MNARQYAAMVRMHLTLREHGWVPEENGTELFFNVPIGTFYRWAHPGHSRLMVKTINGAWFVLRSFDDGRLCLDFGNGVRSLLKRLQQPGGVEGEVDP